MITEEQRERVLKWIAALRSGEYNQSFRALRGITGYCCLGVACEISGLSKWEAGKFYLGEESELPNQVRLYYGLKGRDGRYLICKTLTKDNDCGNSFEIIANTIEKALDNPEMEMFV